MKINAIKLGLAGSITTIILYTAFALMLKIWTTPTLKFMGTIYMMPKLDYISSFIKVTPYALCMAIATHFAVVFVFFALMATIYNLLQRN